MSTQIKTQNADAFIEALKEIRNEFAEAFEKISEAIAPKVYTVKELAELLKVEDQIVRRMIKGEQISAFKVGSQYRVTEEALKKYINENKAA